MPPWWQLTEPQRTRRRAGIVRMVRTGKPVSAAAARYGVTVRTAYLACRAQGMRFDWEDGAGAGAAHRRLLEEIVRAGRQGLTAAQLAERFGVTRRVVSNACRRAGLDVPRSVQVSTARSLALRTALRPRARELAARYASARSRRAARLLLTTDRSFQDIADRCGLVYQRVWQVWSEIRRAATRSKRR